MITSVVLTLFVGQAVAQAQQAFEGKAVYVMSGEEHPNNATLTYYIRPEAMRLEMDMDKMTNNKRNRGNGMGMGAGGSGVMIFKQDKAYMLMPEQKMYMEMSLNMEGYEPEDQEIEQKDLNKLKMAATGETNEILGYRAKKYVFEDEEEGYRTEAWLTDELGAFVPMQSAGRNQQQRYTWQSQINDYNLFPLEVAVYDQKGRLTTRMTATEIKLMEINEDLVTIPEGYSKMGLGSILNRRQ
ncbi:MAG: DUF4412 domain-containing protein [Bacteroidota bacterium]